MTGDKVVGRASKGWELSEKHTLEWTIRNFEDLEHKPNDELECSPLLCHGYRWSLVIYPRGNPLVVECDDETDDETDDYMYVSIFLQFHPENKATDKVKVKFNIDTLFDNTFASSSIFDQYSPRWGWDEFDTRENILAACNANDKSLTIKVGIQVYFEQAPPWSPRDTMKKDMLKILESKKSADILFVVKGTEFWAHSLILTVRAPFLAALAEDAPDGSPITVEGVDEALFKSILCHAYSGESPFSKECGPDKIDLLMASDRFGCVQLKMLAEAELVKEGIKEDNAAKLLLLADSKNCALLKEAALSFIASHPIKSMKSSGWSDLEKSGTLMAEIMGHKFVARSRSEADESDYDCMDVSTLRQKLEDLELCMDGTREMLIKRLENAHSTK